MTISEFLVCNLDVFIALPPLQSVLPFFVATKMTRIRKPTLDKPTPDRYVAAELGTVGLQSQTNGYFPHAVMVRARFNAYIKLQRCNCRARTSWCH